MLVSPSRRRRRSEERDPYLDAARSSRSRVPIFVVAAVVCICLFSFGIYFIRSGELEDQRYWGVPFQNAVLGGPVGADSRRIQSKPGGFRLVGRRSAQRQSDDLVELIVDDENLNALQQHFRFLRSNGTEVKIDFLRRHRTPPAFNESQKLETHRTNTTMPSPPPGFVDGLRVAHQTFNGTASRLKELLEYEYIAYEKELPYVGNPVYLKMFDESGVNDRQKLLNSLAVFPSAEALHLDPPLVKSMEHGMIGIDRYAQRAYKPSPMPPLAGDPRVNMTDELRAGGGFYRNLSDALPLDRDTMESRDPVCLEQKYDLTQLEDASVIITFYNEHISALLRSIHSVLNRTPAPILREIILVDDHSNSTDLAPGGTIYGLIRTLPKVKLVRMPQRRGIVMARLAGMKLATAPVLVILDSHIEVNEGWLEPQLRRLQESPRSVVMPQIDAIDSEHFNFTRDSGIGCWLGFKWVMQEQASLTGVVKSDHPIPSPSMGGGLFAVRADWFWELGGYDEGFEMWGAENVEMGFRVWLCGGRLECTPCARVYHIYRQGGMGYASPPLSLAKNRLRTSRVWMDEYSKLTELFVAAPKEAEMGNIDRMLELKDRLKCKSFQWFLDHIDPTNEIRQFSDVAAAGEMRNAKLSNFCIDTLGPAEVDRKIGGYGCHGMKGTQGYLLTKNGRLVTFLNDRRCIAEPGLIKDCEFVLDQHGKFEKIETDLGAKIVWHPINNGPETCLGMAINKEGGINVTFTECIPDSGSPDTIGSQRWKLEPFDHLLVDYHPPQYSPQYLERQRIAQSILNKTQNEIIWKYGKKPDGEIADQLVLAD